MAILPSIPVVDVSKVGIDKEEVSEEALRAVGADLHSAFTRCGFVYLSGHGFPRGLPDEVFGASRRFFESHSLEEKASSFPYHPTNLWGYTPPGAEKLDAHRRDDEGAGARRPPASHEAREALDVTRLDGSVPMPDKLAPELRPIFGRLRDAFVPLAIRMLQSIALSVGLEKDYFADFHRKMIKEGNRSDIRSLYYPPIEGEVTPGLTRCGEHFDYGTLTFLIQDDIGGLEVKSSDHGWIQARPVKDTILVNIGDELEIFTNGLFPATFHRVVVPEEEARRRTHRQSIGFFANTDDDTMLAPVVNLDGDGSGVSRYAPISSKEHMDRLCRAART